MKYAMLFRPVSMWTLPDGVEYELTALPQDTAGFNRPDLQRSANHRFGEFTTSRPLTADELKSFEIKEI